MGGWVGAGLIKIKTNSALKLSLSWGLALAELGNIILHIFYCFETSQEVK